MTLLPLLLVASTTLSPAFAEGETTICIAMPKVQIIQGDASTAASGLRDMFASYLTGPTLKSILLEARLTSQAMEEAKQKNCERILITSLSQKRKGDSRLGKVVGRAAETALWYTPGINTAGRAAAAAGARAISAVSATTRARDEFTLEYRMDDAEGKPLLKSRTDKLKAKSDGEDLLTPLVERASEAVAGAVK